MSSITALGVFAERRVRALAVALDGGLVTQELQRLFRRHQRLLRILQSAEELPLGDRILSAREDAERSAELAHLNPDATLPLALLWFGLGNTVSVLIVFYAALFPMLLNTWSGVRAVNPLWLRAAGYNGRFAVTFHDLKEPYLFPKAGLIKAGINPDQFFSRVIFSGGHESIYSGTSFGGGGVIFLSSPRTISQGTVFYGGGTVKFGCKSICCLLC